MNSISNNSSNYFDQALNIEMIKNLCTGKGSSEIAKFILIIGMDQFKILFKAIVDKIIKELNQSKLLELIPGFIRKIFSVLFVPFRYIWNRLFVSKEKTTSHSEFRIIVPEPSCVLKTTAKFQLSFWEQICSEQYKDHLSYDIKTITSINQEDNITIQSSEIWDNIVLNIPDLNIKIELQDEIELQFSSKYNKKVLTSIQGQGQSTFVFEKFKPISEADSHSCFYFNTETTKDESPIVKEKLHEKCVKVHVIPFERIIGSTYVCNLITKFSKYIDINILKSNMIDDYIGNIYSFINTSLIFDPSDLRIFVIFAIIVDELNSKQLSEQAHKFYGKNFPPLVKKDKQYFFGIEVCDKDYTIYFDISKKQSIFCSSVASQFKQLPIFVDNPNNWKLLVNYLFSLHHASEPYEIKTEKSDKEKDYLSIQISSDHYSSQEELQKTFFTYLTTFSKSQPISISKIKTFDIKVVITEKKISVLNPEFEEHKKTN